MGTSLCYKKDIPSLIMILLYGILVCSCPVKLATMTEDEENSTQQTAGVAPSITSESRVFFFEGKMGSFQITATGDPSPTVSYTGTLPSGVAFNASHKTLSGTPSLGARGDYPLRISAQNGIPPDATQDFILKILFPGSLDESFGTGGKVTTGIGTNSDYGHAVVLQPDGKILVAGSALIGSYADFALVRYNSDGSLDNTFGLEGKVTTNLGTTTDIAHAVALQGDGKILVAGESSVGGVDFSIARYNSDGSLDSSFGSAGKVLTTIDYIDVARGIALQVDGKIVLAGYSTNGTNDDFALVRYNTDGSLDTGFGTGGTVVTNIGSTSDIAFDVALQQDGKILTAGVSNGDFALVRYNTDGTLDNTFSGGIVTTAVGSYTDDAYAIALQTDGKILVAGVSGNGSNDDFALVRYNTDGSLDTGFGTGGKVVTAIGTGGDVAYKVRIQSDGKILVAGYSYNGSNKEFALVRYNSDGSLDNTFGTNGIVRTAFGTSDQAEGMAIQSDGKIVLAGYTFIDSNARFALARYWP